MPLLGFKKQFIDKILSGEKRSTIRKYRKDAKNPHPGQTLYLYSGLRTKSCRKLKEVVCKSVSSIYIDRNGYNIDVTVELKDYDALSIAILAQSDGFDTITDFFDFFEKTHGLPFSGLLIEW